MRVCSKCGKQAGDQDIVCSFCGGPLGIGKTDNLRGMKAGEATPRDDIQSAVEGRKATDVRLSPAWTLISFLVILPTTGTTCLMLILRLMIILGFDFDLGEGLSVFIVMLPPIGAVVFGGLFGLLTYYLLSRLNRHIDREERLRAALMSYVRSEARKSGGEQSVMDDLLKLSSFDGQATTYEKKLDPTRWGWGITIALMVGPLTIGIYYVAVLLGFFEDFSLFFALGILVTVGALVTLAGLLMILILASHLMRTIATHEQRWYGFTGSFQAAMSLASKQIELPVADKPMSERSVMLYVVLTFLTMGLFAIYWLYVLIVDPNRHFEHQHMTEDAILAAL